MATAIQVGMSSSQFFCARTIPSRQTGASSSTGSACGPALVALPNTAVVVCQQDNKQQLQAVDVSRRHFTVAAASVTTLGVFSQPEAQAGKRKPPPAEEKKKVEEDKGMSAYDQKLLAQARRKEAMKAAVEAQKAKAKSVAGGK